MTGPYRVPPTAGAKFGTALDRSEPVGFRLGSRALSGLYGDTVASALMAAGLREPFESPLLGRPRGLIGLGLEDAGLFAVDGDKGPFAFVSGDEIMLKEGLKVRRAGMKLARAIRRFAPAAGPDRRALPLPQRLLERLRRLAPLPAPRLPAAEPPPLARRATCDAVVIGAGLAGLSAASALAASGLDVRVVEASWRSGGTADLYEGTIDGRGLADWAAVRAGELRDRGGLTLGATAVAIDPDGVTTLERSDPQRPGAVTLRLISAPVVVVATGFRERPMVFPGNDRPGVLLAGAARALLRRHGVAPGARVLVATRGDEGHRAAVDLRQAGVDVVMTLDERDDPQGAAVDLSKALGAPVSFATVPTGVDFDEKSGAISGAGARNRHGEGASAGARVFSVDAVVASGGFAPRDELLRQSGASGLHVAHLGPNAVEAVAGGWAAGVAAASELGRAPGRDAPVVEAVADDAVEPPEFTAAMFAGAGADSAFVDFGADVTLGDLRRAVDRRGEAPAAVARRLGLGLGADQGRLSADLSERALEALAGRGAPGPSCARMTLGLLAARAGLRDD